MVFWLKKGCEDDIGLHTAMISSLDELIMTAYLLYIAGSKRKLKSLSVTKSIKSKRSYGIVQLLL